jgi:rhodanese-related sulfurtransferase
MAFLGGNKEKPIIFYCLDEKWVRSHCGASWALKMGYRRVYRCVDGISAWKKAGYPVEKWNDSSKCCAGAVLDKWVDYGGI